MAEHEVYVVSPLGGAYRGGQETRRVITHAAFDSPGVTKAFCGYPLERLADIYAAEPSGTLPTCEKCRSKLNKLLRKENTRMPEGSMPAKR